MCGYLGTRSDISKNLSFVPLKDAESDHQIQIVSNPASAAVEAHECLRSLKAHQPVIVEGIVKPKVSKGSGKVDEDGPTRDVKNVELLLQRIQPLNDLHSDVLIKSGAEYGPEQRHLRLRVDATLRDTLRMRDRIMRVCHYSLQDFLFVETPVLFKSTSEGASEFIVPTRRKSLAYALPQSPQQFKQILMAGGVSKYYQFAKCFRDEDLRAHRQPEFTQVCP